MKKYAVIVAAGAGRRMQSDIPKQFMLLRNKPVFFYSVNTFLNTYDDIEIILVMPKQHQYQDDELLQHFEKKSQIKIITGGDTRYESVKNSLDEITEEGIVFIHDAVRPFINKLFLDELLAETIKKGNAVPYTDVNDSLRLVLEDTSTSVNRDQMKAIQTPQVFQASIIKRAYRHPFIETFTDDASVAESHGEKINLVKGLTENIKITRPLDFKYAELMMDEISRHY